MHRTGRRSASGGLGQRGAPEGVQTEVFPEPGGGPAIAESAGRLHGEGGEFDLDHVGIVGGGLVAVGEEAQLAALAVLVQDVDRVLPGIELGGVEFAQVEHLALDHAVAADAQALADRVIDVGLAVFGAGAPFDEQHILSNDGALRLQAVPKKLGLIGSGVIGLEMGSVWRRLGAKVTILEALPTFLSAVDVQIAAEAQKVFTKQGLAIELGVTVGQVTTSTKGIHIAYTNFEGNAQSLEVDKLIVSIGRVPNTDGLNPQAVGLDLDERGAIVVDNECRTNLANVWAVGDVVRGPMLAHKAEEEGVVVAERIAGQQGHVNFNTIPWVIYTSPEMAWVGRTEQQLKADGVAYRAGTFPFLANGRARALGDTTGMVKMLADAVSDEILGVHIIGPMASELIAECVVAMEFRASSEDIARICHAHPSLSESTKEAALAVDKRSLNF